MYLQIGQALDSIPAAPPSPPAPTPIPTRTTHDVKVVVKSYIAPIGRHLGATRCAAIDPTALPKLIALATGTDAAFSENPLTDRKDRKYRLFSSRTFRVTCAGGRI